MKKTLEFDQDGDGMIENQVFIIISILDAVDRVFLTRPMIYGLLRACMRIVEGFGLLPATLSQVCIFITCLEILSCRNGQNNE